MVQPSEPTPCGSLNLSVIDGSLELRFNISSLFVYRDGNERSANIIRKALSKALVPYYPFAGRLQETSDDGKLHVCCNGEGVWFVEAFANSSLADVNYHDDAPEDIQEKLLPNSIPKTPGLDPIMMIQVTSFKCGGFVAAFVFSHNMCDGTGLCQFLNALVLTACLWRSRSRAINLDPNSNTKLIFYANIRQILNPSAPRGFYGNCFFPVTIVVSSGWLVKAPVAEVVRVVQEAKANLPIYVNKWIYNKGGDDEKYLIEEPLTALLDYATMCVSTGENMGFDSIDYGWDRPLHSFLFVPSHPTHMFPLGLISPAMKSKTGIYLRTWCVDKSHLPSLQNELVILLKLNTGKL
ncbi:hypothetical protein Sjap_005230 [Stephania japonica]|uniref:Uncharacterized protein n=1 Tax=Stephania japonica TaxID=461633 RepID=A0AAP0PIJ5_9MAGN